MSKREIKKIVPINLKRRLDKLIAFSAASQVVSIPPDIIKPFEAKDAADFSDVYEVRDAAVVDFPFWSKLTDEWLDGEWLGPGSLCCMWSMQLVLQDISENSTDTDLVIMMTDHYFLTKKWHQLESDIDAIGDFDLFQLHHWFDDARMPYSPSFPSPLVHFPEVSEGLAGAGDTCLIISKLGAGNILDWWESQPFHLLEVLLHIMAHRGVDNCLSAVYAHEWTGGPLSVEKLTGKPDSERLVRG